MNLWIPRTPDLLLYCDDLYRYQRRRTREVMVGEVGVGGDNPIRVQSMITSDTRDTAACVAEALELAEVGCEIVRITAQTRRSPRTWSTSPAGSRAAGCEVPLVADIHFKPDAALEAAKWVEKVRVNPGNYADKKKFADPRIHATRSTRRNSSGSTRQFSPLVRAVQGARAGDADRDESRVAVRPDHEPLRRHAARHGRERAGVRPHRAARRLPRVRVLDEGEQPEGDDRGLPPAGRAAGRARARTGTTRSTSA